MTVFSVYSLDASITDFFLQTSATCEVCDAKAKDLVGGEIVPVSVQGSCSYSVYAGSNQEFVVQFRLKSLKLPSETAALAREVYGSIAPNTSFHGQLGWQDKEPLLVYVMNRVMGISHLDFILKNKNPEHSNENFAWRKTLISDMARFLALSWKAPQAITSDYRESLRQTYTMDMQLLLQHLPTRFHCHVQRCLDSMDSILALPMVLLHPNLSTTNIMVDSTSCHLTGVVDWAEAEICPFGQNLCSLETFTGKLDLKTGWKRYDDHKTLQDTFWCIFQDEVGLLPADTLKTIQTAQILGLLRSHGFTARLANMPPASPIRDDEIGRYRMLYLDGLLINVDSRFDDLE